LTAVKQGLAKLGELLKKAFNATMNALKKLMLAIKKFFFEAIVKQVQKMGRLAGFYEVGDMDMGADAPATSSSPIATAVASGVIDSTGKVVQSDGKVTLKSLGCAFEKHLKKTPIQFELAAEAAAAIAAGYFTGGAAAALAGVTMATRHVGAVITLAGQEGCGGVKNPVDPNNPNAGSKMSPLLIAGLGVGGIALAAYALSGDSQTSKKTPGKPGKGKAHGNSRRR
jgi:hypothetical protein